ncbi:uncharacterized protein [Centruroides vittatus]|uniref:uncharacterized protein n=1 Tax=Centruroides vittatus TaxID=120091 RepID=UPI00350F9515
MKFIVFFIFTALIVSCYAEEENDYENCLNDENIKCIDEKLENTPEEKYEELKANLTKCCKTNTKGNRVQCFLKKIDRLEIMSCIKKVGCIANKVKKNEVVKNFVNKFVNENIIY